MLRFFPVVNLLFTAGLLDRTLQILLSNIAGELLDGISQHGSRHAVIVLLQKGFFRASVPLANFPQHPAHGLVNQVLGIRDKALCDLQRFVEFAFLDEVKGSHDGNPAFPQDLRPGQFIQRFAVPVIQVGAYDMLGRDVNKVPVVDILCVGQVQFVDLCLFVGRASLVFFGENDQSEQAFFVYYGVELGLYIGYGQFSGFPGYPAYVRDPNTDEPVAFTIFTGAGLEESPQALRMRFI